MTCLGSPRSSSTATIGAAWHLGGTTSRLLDRYGAVDLDAELRSPNELPGRTRYREVVEKEGLHLGIQWRLVRSPKRLLARDLLQNVRREEPRDKPPPGEVCRDGFKAYSRHGR